MMNMQRIQYFAVVAQARSLSDAARQLGITQPALTASIRKLEAELGLVLFDREPRFELSIQGREFLPHVENMLARAQDLQREAALLQSGESGDLRVACGPTVADGLMGPALAGVMARHPGVRVHVHVGPFRDLPAMLKARTIDLFVADYTLLESDSELEIQPLDPQEIVFFCRAGHPMARKRTVSPDEFFAYPHVGPDLPAWAESWLRHHRPGHHGSGELSLRCSHHALLKTVVLSSDAVSGAPLAVIAPELKSGSLVVVKLELPKMITRAGVVIFKGRSLSQAAQTLISQLKLA